MVDGASSHPDRGSGRARGPDLVLARGGDGRAGRGTVMVRGAGQLDYVVPDAAGERGNAWELGGNGEISGSRCS